MSIFEFNNYKTFLESKAEAAGKRGGFKSALADACGCNSAYISNVFADKAHLSLEQAERACEYLHLTEPEAHYFLLLVQQARAGTSQLRNYFHRQIQQILEQKLNIQKRLGAPEKMSKSNQSRYYSSWIYGAVHVALSIPRFAKSEEVLAKYLGLSVKQVRKAQEFLISAGLATRTSAGAQIQAVHTHLGRNSDDLAKHHMNWRVAAMRAIENDTDQSLHYSSVVTLSKEDSYKIREIYLSAIKESADLIIDSPAEEIYAMTLDFFPMKQGQN